MRKDARGFVEKFVGRVRKAEDDYTRKTNEAITAAVTEEAKVKLVDVLRRLKEERQSAWDLAKQVVSQARFKDYNGHQLAFVADIQRMLNEAYGLTDATGQPAAAGQPVPVAVPSAN